MNHPATGKGTGTGHPAAQSDGFALARDALVAPEDAFVLLRAVRDEHGAIVDFTVGDANARAETLFGGTRAQSIGERLTTLSFVPCAAAVVRQCAAVVENGVPVDEEYPIRAPGIAATWLRHHIARVGDGVTVVVRDISATKQEHTSLVESEARFRNLFEHSSDGILVCTPDGEIRDANPRFCVLIGRSRVDLIGTPVADLVDGADLSRRPLRVEELATSGALEVERQMRRPDGTELTVEATTTLLASGQVQIIVRDVSARRAAEEALRQSESRLALALDGANAGLWDWSLTTDELYISPTTWAMLGYAPGELASTPDQWEALTHPDDRATVRAARARHMGAGPGRSESDYRVRRKDGTWSWVQCRGKVVERDITGRPLRATGTHTDVTARRTLEEFARQSQKLEAVAKLAGGVAHDFNNLLAAIRSSTELLLLDAPADDADRVELENIANACERATVLTRQLLTFTRQNVQRVAEQDIDEVVRGVEPLLRRLLTDDSRLVVALSAPGATVRIDATQLELALMNLVTNAREAMPNGGTVRIETERVTLDRTMLAAIPGLEPGAYLRVVVSDTGTGMTPEVRAHLFEPFFTTKPLGTGTGLGLATVYGVVRQSGGAINCTSSVGAGTRFELYLPLVAGMVVGEGSVGAEPPVVRQGNTRSVLVVDDEATVCGAIARLLRRTGYRAATATSGEEALLVLEAADGDFDLLLTDFAMPGMNGRELLAAARARWPWLNVLLMSAFTPDEEMRRALRDTATPFLAKPFTLSELLETVRAMNPRPRTGA